MDLTRFAIKLFNYNLDYELRVLFQSLITAICFPFLQNMQRKKAQTQIRLKTNHDVGIKRRP